MRVALVTLGCPKNEVDSRRMAAALGRAGHSLVEDHRDADAVVLNTCAFIQEAVEESIAATLELAAWRAEGAGRTLIVSGCMPSRYGSGLSAELPEVDAFLPVADVDGIVEALAAASGVAPPGGGAALFAAPVGPAAYLMVSDGCDKRCTYCTIPSIRGPYRSRSASSVLEEAAELVSAGARELILVGQDITAWGRDLAGDEVLADVVDSLACLDGVVRLRLMYAQPEGVTDRLLESMASNPSVCHYLDVPLQHAARRVLRAMGRAGDAESHLALLERVRTAMPDVVLRTSLIAGFPGETEEDVAELEAFIETARFDYAGVFAYSPEEGTPAASLRPRIRAAERQERANRLRSVADAIGVERAAAHVGETLDVLVDGVDEDGRTVGRWCGQAPEVDGVVSLDGEHAPGTVVRMRIVDSLGYDLVGLTGDA